MADKEVSALTDAQLRERLGSYPGQDVPPITQSTRKPLERRLLKLMSGSATPISKPPVPSAPVVPVTPKSSTVPATHSVRVPEIKRTPSPPIAPLPRATISPRKNIRSGAAFSSDEDEDVVDTRSSGQRKLVDITAGTPVRGYLNGRFFGTNNIGPSSSSDTASSGSKSGFGGWLSGVRTPRTSTPQERRAGHLVHESFGQVTPIRDEAGLRRRPALGRPSLASFGAYRSEESPPPGLKKRSLLGRFMGDSDPIHLTPQARDHTFTRHSPPRPRPLQFLNNSGKEEGSWFSRHSTAFLWGLFIAFFLLVGAAYGYLVWNQSDVSTTILRYKFDKISDADNLFVCPEDAGTVSGTDAPVCYQPEEIINSLEMATALSKHLSRLKGEALCEGTGKIRMGVSEARGYAVDAVPKGGARDFVRAVHLIVANPHWGIRALDSQGRPASVKEDVREFESEHAYKSLVCRWKEALANLLVKILLIVFGVLALVAFVWYVVRLLKGRAQRQEQVYEMVNQIIGIVHNSYKTAKKEGRLPAWSVVSHVREDLLPHGSERKKLLSVWNDAVKYINAHESRISSDIRQINGDDFEVWNWLPTKSEENEPDSPVSHTKPVAAPGVAVNGTSHGPPKHRPRFWGAGPTPAKSVVAENITAATPCLKVRGMFDGQEENQNDVATWSAEVTDAILERCHGIARIYDIAVEPTSDEGIVYIKLATNEDARNAYMALAGQYFADREVKVKFLKLDRYHHRFPDAIDKTVPLLPSKQKHW